MHFLTKVTRRTVLQGQAALVGLSALPSMAMARFSTPAPEAVVPSATSASATPALAPRWETATAKELTPFIGERFRVKTKDHGNLVLKLVSVEPSRSNADRPAHLPRSEGVVAVFDSPDIAPLVADGEGLYRVHHPRIGAASLYMAAAPRRHGGAFIEVVLN